MFGLEKLFGNKSDYEQLKKGGAIVLDVRTAGEYRGGHIPGSMNVSLDSINTVIKQLKAAQKPVITCCQSGMRSYSAAAILKKEGIEAHNGGAWESLLKKLS